jgi:hypothetical protein
MKQLYDVVTNQIPKPIATPVKNMLPARDTCEECHWPGRAIGNIDRTFYHYLSDDQNTPFAVRLLMKVGGGEGGGGIHGAHVHAGQNEKIEYIATDDQRQVIPWVRVTDTKTGNSIIYHDKDFHDDPAKYEIRTMDCIDCHNRPAHQFHEPNDVVDEAITAGRLDRSVPKLKLNVVTALVGNYQDTAEAMQKIASSLHADYPDRADVDGIVAETQQLFRVNFFPEMKTDWRAHPNNIGHKTSPGCFRCHDGNHKTDDGTKSIAADNCNSCHIILAQGNSEELKDIKADGHDFHHIDSTYLDFSCTGCHTGAITK